MVTVALYEKKIKQAPNNESRTFYLRMREAEINRIVPSVTLEVDGVKYTFDYDEKFSKDAGHYGYVKRGNDDSNLTPFGE